ncbi:hypothetical protein WG78_04715 [Amantichitinum ursilacus]|uniref:Uncharacterized protein n=1 Tax=Amantichitinum ursilacus TaxID=857265 RepID=A0A0N0XMA3_9NEIS|nr:hypothetical protein WG78_04715 [Amantichitinum ursilacus]
MKSISQLLWKNGFFAVIVEIVFSFSPGRIQRQ